MKSHFLLILSAFLCALFSFFMCSCSGGGAGDDNDDATDDDTVSDDASDDTTDDDSDDDSDDDADDDNHFSDDDDEDDDADDDFDDDADDADDDIDDDADDDADECNDVLYANCIQDIFPEYLDCTQSCEGEPGVICSATYCVVECGITEFTKYIACGALSNCPENTAIFASQLPCYIEFNNCMEPLSSCDITRMSECESAWIDCWSN
jgi:hypothetical protein